MNMNSIQEILAENQFFHAMPDEYLKICSANAVKREFGPGQILFHQGEPAAEFFILQSGLILVEDEESGCHVDELVAGDVLGWAWLFPPFVWHFRARAAERTCA